MEPISKRYQNGRRQNNQENMPEEEIRTPERHFDNLDNEFTGRLRHCRRSQASSVPFTRPPGAVRLVVLVLTSKEDCDQELLDGPLNRNDGDDTQYCVGSIPQFQEPLFGKVLVHTYEMEEK